MTKHKVLIIEDDAAIAGVQRTYLEAAGLEVETESDGQAGLRRALEERPDLIILDLNLPGIDGFEVCRRLRERLESLIVMVTGRSGEAFKIRGLEIGAVDYILKPFSPAELTARVKAHLTQYERLMNSGRRADREICFGRVRILTDRREVFVEELRAELANKEYELLVHLAAHPDQDFTKERLYQEVWGREKRGDLKTVAVHIKRLRDKLEADPVNPRHIRTIKGAGYRFTL